MGEDTYMNPSPSWNAQLGSAKWSQRKWRSNFSAFSSEKALLLIHGLDSEQGSFEHMKNALRKAYGRTAEEAKLALCYVTIAKNEMAQQAHARITRFFFYELFQKEEIQLTVEAFRELVIKDKFKMCPLEFVATAKSQETIPSDKTVETIALDFKAHGRRNVPRSRPIGNKP